MESFLLHGQVLRRLTRAPRMGRRSECWLVSRAIAASVPPLLVFATVSKATEHQLWSDGAAHARKIVLSMRVPGNRPVREGPFHVFLYSPRAKCVLYSLRTDCLLYSPHTERGLLRSRAYNSCTVSEAL